MSGCIVYGSTFAANRYKRYLHYGWRDHSMYKGFRIERCYDGEQPKGLYRAVDSDTGCIIIGEGLLQVKAAISDYIAHIIDTDCVQKVIE